MLALRLLLSQTYYAQNYASIIGLGLAVPPPFEKSRSIPGSAHNTIII